MSRFTAHVAILAAVVLVVTLIQFPAWVSPVATGAAVLSAIGDFFRGRRS
jgi:hypothetical protein